MAVTASRVLAQGYDDHNPVGVTGIFNGNVTTACSYDPLTHIAMTESVSLRWHRRIARLLAATLE